MVKEDHTKHRQKKESAVSPVIGVMLMLAITIIIAGTVTIFATQFADGSKNDIGITKVSYVGFDDGGSSAFSGHSMDVKDKTLYAVPFGLVFEVESGNPVDLKNLRLDLDDFNKPGGGGRCTISYNDYIAEDYAKGSGKGIGATRLLPPAGSTKRFVPYPYNPNGSTIIQPGEKFMIMGEYYTPPGTSALTNMLGIATVRSDEGSTARYNSAGYNIDSSTYYTLVDESTGYVLAKGNLGEGKRI